MRTRTLLVVVLVLFAGVTPPPQAAQAQDDVFQIVYVAVRQGDGAIYQGPCGEVAIIDTPQHRHHDMAAALDTYAGTRTIAWVNVSHYHSDHVGGLVDLDGLPGVSIGAVYDRGGGSDAYHTATYQAYHDWVTSTATTRQPVQIGEVLTLCSGSQQVTFEVISVGRDGAAADDTPVTNEDDHSVCLKITYRQFRSATCGDLSGVNVGDRTDMESVVAPTFGDVHVARVNHHGSPNSSNTTYTTTLSPDVAVISVGANGFGHPAPSVIANWQAAGAQVWQTHKGGPAAEGGNDLVNGNIRVTTNGLSGYQVVGSAGGAQGFSLDGTDDPGDSNRSITRLFGPDRVATAIALSQHGWPNGAATVLVARSDNFPDALAAGALSAQLDAPILLTPPEEFPDQVGQELIRLAPDEPVILLGGSAAVSAQVENAINAAGFTTERIFGPDRYETAGQIARRAGAPGLTFNLASGENFPDALAAGSLTAAPGQPPTLLTTRDAIPPATHDAISDLGLNTDSAAAVIGGAAVISQSVQDQLQGDVTRLSGPTRFETGQAVVSRSLELFGTEARPLLIATGDNFPDALAAGGLAAKLDAPLLLVPTADLSDGLAAFVSSHRTRFDSAIVIGGSAAVTQTVFDQINRVINGQPKDPATPPPPPPPDPACVDLNTASFEDLQQIVHIGADRAQQIIDMRPWTSVDQMISIDGIGPARLQDIKDQGLACVL